MKLLDNKSKTEKDEEGGGMKFVVIDKTTDDIVQNTNEPPGDVLLELFEKNVKFHFEDETKPATSFKSQSLEHWPKVFTCPSLF